VATKEDTIVAINDRWLINAESNAKKLLGPLPAICDY